MSKIIVFSEKNGVSICHPAPDADIKDVLMRDCPDGAIIVNAADIPDNPEYSRSWVIVDEKISIDMTVAREVHREKLRQAREPLFTQLDKEWIIADERGDEAKKTNIRAKKKSLRDVTDDPAIEAAKTISELINIWPDCLK